MPNKAPDRTPSAPPVRRGDFQSWVKMIVEAAVKAARIGPTT